jgi:nitrite reductase (NO-forming)
MPKVDREFFIVQGEFYTDAPFGTPGHRSVSLEKALKEEPDYVVFNGHVGALMGDGALRASVGESVRLYLGNAGPSLLSSFHIVGEIFDNVYGEGGSRVTQNNVQSTLVPVGGSAMVEFVADVAGRYSFVDHSMFRAFNKGAMGTLDIAGPAHSDIFPGKLSESVYNPGTRLQRSAGAVPSVAAATLDDLVATATLEHGRQVYSALCAACHQAAGEGMPGVIPPLAHSDFLMSDPQRAVRVLLEGLSGPITVNGKEYRGVMPKLPLSDHDIAAVLSYVRNAFGNTGSSIELEDVERARASLKGLSEQSEQVAIERP